MSDNSIYSMGKRINVTDLDQFYDGLKTACSKWNVDIVGGDTTSSYTGLSINITCIGESVKEDIVYRKGATPTDIICVSGDLGAAYMGLTNTRARENSLLSTGRRI